MTSICLVEEVVEFAGHKAFKKATIELTPDKLNGLSERINSVLNLQDYTSHFIKNHVQQPTPGTDHEAQHPLAAGVGCVALPFAKKCLSALQPSRSGKS